MWDELLSVLDEVFASCYTWIPASWQNNAPCSGTISIPDCPDVGISTPLEVIIYYGYQLFGSVWCQIMTGLASSRLFDWFIPNFLSDTRTTCYAIQHASATQMERQLACAAVSSGTLAWVVLGVWGTAMFVVIIVPALLNIIHALILLFPLLPFYDALVGMGSPQGVFVIPNEDEQVNQNEEEEDEETETIQAKFVPVRSNIVTYVARAFKRRFLPKDEKLE